VATLNGSESRDNGVAVIVPALLTNTPQLREQIHQVSPLLGPDVVRINFEIGFDAMGFDSIFFNIVLTDEASHPSRLRIAVQRIALILMNHLRTDENGVHAYFNFRSQSEAAHIDDPAWAAMS
jgi:hypothetical protein